MRYPDFLKQDGTIGFIAPSFGCNIEPYKSAFLSAISKLEAMGYRSDLGPNCFLGEGFGISNTPEACAKEFNEYYLDKDCDILISCGGGEVMCEILPYIDFRKIAGAKPKLFMGYSDNTNLSFLLPTLCDTVSVYGPNAGAFGMEPYHPSIEDTLALLKGEKLAFSNYHGWEKESIKSENNPLAPYQITEPFELHIFDGEKGAGTSSRLSGKAEFRGRLLGGCLDVLGNLVGTRFDKVADFNEKYKDDGIVWFLEACELNPLQVRRTLWHLKMAGWFSHARGFIIGRPMIYGTEVMGLDQYRAVTEMLHDLHVPIIMDADIGHLPPMMPLITGSLAEVKADSTHLSIRNIIEQAADIK